MTRRPDDPPTRRWWAGYHELHAGATKGAREDVPRETEREALERLRDERLEAFSAFGSGAQKPQEPRGADLGGSESQHQAALTAAVARLWWAPGYRHHMAERASRSEAWRGRRAGVEPGWPDVTVHIPRVQPYYEHEPHCLLALELKRPDARPKRAVEPEWWLAWARETDVDPLRVNEPTRHGLRLSQARCLALLDSCGYHTMVAFGVDEAIEWLVERAGPRPVVMPEGW